MKNKRLAILMATFACSAIGAAAIMHAVPASWSPPVPVAPNEVVEGIRDVGLLAHGGGLDNLATRPPFSRTRQARMVTDDRLQDDSAGFDDVLLIGIFESSGTAGVFLRHEDVVKRLAVGAHWRGWTLKDVDPESKRARFVGPDGAETTVMLARRSAREDDLPGRDDANNSRRADGTDVSVKRVDPGRNVAGGADERGAARDMRAYAKELMNEASGALE